MADPFALSQEPKGKKGKKKKRKDVTLVPPDLPNGIQDHYALSSAAEALSGLLNGTEVAEAPQKLKGASPSRPALCHAVPR
jgi:LDH2 family malate/lactate/ureidoglycolate dehydrogenase